MIDPCIWRLRAPWTPERRAQASAYQRARHGAPEGYCTIYGVHVPFEHRDPIRYWADRFAHYQGSDGARAFVLTERENEWRGVPRLRELWLEKRQCGRNRALIQQIEWEAYRANRNGG